MLKEMIEKDPSLLEVLKKFHITEWEILSENERVWALQKLSDSYTKELGCNRTYDVKSEYLNAVAAFINSTKEIIFNKRYIDPLEKVASINDIIWKHPTRIYLSSSHDRRRKPIALAVGGIRLFFIYKKT